MITISNLHSSTSATIIMSDAVNSKTSPFSLVPEGCIAHVISLTSPKDACRLAAISQGFKSAADSDTVWERFLPPNYNEIISRTSSPLAFATKKQLFFLLRHSTLILDGGKLSFSLTKSGEKWYLMSSRALQIAAIDNPQNWEWTSLPESRFADVAKLRSISMLEIHGIMPARMLSPKTHYVAWLKCMFTEVDDGLDVPSKASIKFVKEDGTVTEGESNVVYLVKPHNHSHDKAFDGWYGIELGEFFIGEEDSFDVQIKVSETQRLNQKKGLVIEGIELRPKNGLVIKGIELRPNNYWNFEDVSSGDDEASSEEVSFGEDEASSEEVLSSGDDEASSEEVLSSEEDEYSSEEISSNSEKVSSVEDDTSFDEESWGEDEADFEEVSSKEDEANLEEVSSGEDESNVEEISPGEDEADTEEASLREDEASSEEISSNSEKVSWGLDEAEFEEVSSKEDDSNLEEVSSGEDESNVEEISPGEDEASFEEVFSGEDEATIEEAASLREDEASCEEVYSWGEGEAEVSLWEDEANFEEPSWVDDEEIFYV